LGESLGSRQNDVRELGIDKTFVRLWDFSLGHREGGFLTHYLSDLQLVLT
jgi:hypothetical protein